MPSQFTPEYVAKFWLKVEKSAEPDGCWLWKLKPKPPGGYGYCYVFRQRYTGAHRVSWMISFGDIPYGMFVCHHCDNPRCVRPDHLFLGTPGDNARDAMNKGRLPRGDNHYFSANPRRGEQSPRAKLTQQQVDAIRERLANGTTLVAAAREFGVCKATISHIKQGRNWGSHTHS